VIFRAFTDGASRGNPGESGIGVIVYDESGMRVAAWNGYLGTSTNNRAEYTALIMLLEEAGAFRCDRLLVHSDSELMVRQMAGQYKVKDRSLREMHRRASEILKGLPFPVEVRHVPREQNREADRLANEAIDARAPRLPSAAPGDLFGDVR
jgi:ribonuclease HI